MPNRLTLGIDVGTTSVKAGIVDGSGRVVARFAQSYPTLRRGSDIAEQDPDDWVRLISDAMASFADFEISAIGITGQVNTHVFVDREGTALLPAILWQDGRAGGEAAGLDARVSAAQKQAWWGAPMPIDASHACSRMAWVARHHPDIWEKTRWVMLPKDYCLLKLTGEATTDPISNIGLVDNTHAYIAEVFDLVPGAADRKVPLVPVCDVVGTVAQGPFAGVPVVSGTMDAWAGLVGAGGAKDGSTVYLSGTSEILGISSHDVVPTPGIIVFPEADGIRLHAAPTQSGGDAKVWFSQAGGVSLDQMTELVARTERRAATPLFLPQLQGERAPLWDADLRAAFLGVGRQTNQQDLARAVYEGVAMSARMALEALQKSAGVVSDTIACGGGGFQSDPWAQIRADILGVELTCLAAKDPGILGAAAMAAIGVGHFRAFGEAYDALAVFDRTFTPDPASHTHYNDLFDLYRDAIAVNADLGKRLSKLDFSTV
ncbi:xylulokinase [Jannaschia sp. CCS1]|uniref:xylulokinase n=1 Tax=Jannaschia sp. (strain CCS1) TaxID=290400 RepID=UPI000053D96F|nr:FGGY family carbohydrate kinase [Jannaschia sp. CCS1]ABD55324.1 carbohydrate kinase FGGY [Jannaschia sp. CCS1]